MRGDRKPIMNAPTKDLAEALTLPQVPAAGLPIFLTIALYSRTYSLASLTNWRLASRRVLVALLLAATLLNFFAFLTKSNELFSRAIFVSGLSAATVLMFSSRAALQALARKQWGPMPINRLVIDAGGPPLDLPHAFRIDAELYGLSPDLDDPHAFDRFSHYVRNMDEVIVNCSLERRAEWAMMLKGTGVRGEVTSTLSRQLGVLGVIEREGAEFQTLLVSKGPLGMFERVLKRGFDLGFSSLALILLSPLLLTAMVAILMEDGGPVLFSQRRLGRGNRLFRIYKLRTMREDGSDADGRRSASRADDRITRVGRMLRRTSVDELPQLFNVLRGDMSLVGPRPHALGSQAGEKWFWEIDQRYWQRHSLRPGMTGLAQIRGWRGATETESDLSSRLQSDLEYLTDWSLWRDVAIIVATVRVLVHERAY
jgi:lipopolysaccharide/colanic/teichoic acid biosynthesis glycosyltransferase